MRVCWKIPYINNKYFGKYYNKKHTFKIKYKNSLIGFNFIDKHVLIYNGKYNKKLDIIPAMIGYKFGEFIAIKTSHEYIHLKKSKKKRKKTFKRKNNKK